MTLRQMKTLERAMHTMLDRLREAQHRLPVEDDLHHDFASAANALRTPLAELMKRIDNEPL